MKLKHKEILRILIILMTLLGMQLLRKPISAVSSKPQTVNFQEHVVDSTGGPGESVAIDFDRDGDTDIIRLNVDTGDYFWHENDGSQNFTRRTLSFNNTPPKAAINYVIADVDQDDDYDIVASGGYMALNLIHWYENDGTNLIFNKHVLEEVIFGQYIYSSLQSLDFDGDGDIDVVTSVMYLSGGEDSYDNLLIFSNDGNQNFSRSAIVNDDLRMAFSFAVTDVEQDGDNDVAVAGSTQIGSGHVLRWYENTGAFPFVSHVVEQNDLLTVSVRAADINNDGYTDIIADQSTALVWYEGSADHDYSIKHVIDEFGEGSGLSRSNLIQMDSGSTGSKIRISDMDSDGDLDIVFSASTVEVPRLYVYLNDGGASFAPRQTVDNGDFVLNILPSVADINNNGFNDIIANGNNKLSWFENLSELQTIDLYGQNLTGIKIGGKKLEVSLDVLNGGNTAAGEFKVVFFVKGNAGSVDDINKEKIRRKIGEAVIPSLEPGETYHISQVFWVKDLDLYKVLLAGIDPDNLIQETDENNNRLMILLQE